MLVRMLVQLQASCDSHVLVHYYYGSNNEAFLSFLFLLSLLFLLFLLSLLFLLFLPALLSLPFRPVQLARLFLPYLRFPVEGAPKNVQKQIEIGNCCSRH